MDFPREYETYLASLKADFIAAKDWERHCLIQGMPEQDLAARTDFAWKFYAQRRDALRELMGRHATKLDLVAASSLYGLPTHCLSPNEYCLHRIWMGGPLPELARAAIAQWRYVMAALPSELARLYRHRLWVWDVAQVQKETDFVEDSTDPICFGRFHIGGLAVEVCSLRALLEANEPTLIAVLQGLHEERCYVNLSDYFRLRILQRDGGLYLDADTLPCSAALLYLVKPELPDYLSFELDPESGVVIHRHISWMNANFDENGILIARRGDLAVGNLIARTEAALLALGPPGGEPGAAYHRALQQATYELWRREMGVSFISHDSLMQSHALWYRGDTERVCSGIVGMRLSSDPVLGVERPLSAEEKAAREACLAELERRHWKLESAGALAEFAPLSWRNEAPRMAYPPQLRSEQGHCHYYSFLSDDSDLDRVNALFAAYLVQSNAEHVVRSDFWYVIRPCQSGHRPSSVYWSATSSGQYLEQAMVHFLPGTMVETRTRDRMARLLFATSYLEYCSYNNKLGLPFVALQRKQNIDPYIELIDSMFDAQGEFVGFFSAGRLVDYAQAQSVSYYRDEMAWMDAAYDAFVEQHARPDDLFVANLAIEPKYRGRGHYRTMFNAIEARAKRQKCRRIVLTVWGQSEALALYERTGFQRVGVFEAANPVFFDQLHFLAYPIALDTVTAQQSLNREPHALI